MAGIGKCMGIMSGIGLVGGAATSYFMQNKTNKVAMEKAKAHAQNGKIKIGGMTPDGKLWDGEMTLDEFKKNLNKKTAITSAISGVISAVTTAIVAGLTLLLGSKIIK